MEDLENLEKSNIEPASLPESSEAAEEDIVEDQYEPESGVSFDDIVSFTMLLETAVMLIAIAIFTIFFVL
jgi:hypothetical protein